MKTLLVTILALASSSFAIGQSPPIPIDQVEWSLVQSNGDPVEHPRTGEDLNISAKFTVTDPFNGTLEGEISLDETVIEQPIVQYIMDGLYYYENPAKGTHGYYMWNPAGYYDTWSSYNGGTTRRMVPNP